jgi:mono/diheme cytochrome c family protein
VFRTGAWASEKPAAPDRAGPHALRCRGLAQLCAGALAVMIGIAGSASAAERTLNDAVYSRAQARAGKQVYEAHCISCHDRGYFREVLRARQGESLASLFEVMVALMPQNAPGSLSDRDYVDIIAYIVSQARYDDGKQRLRVSDLSSITIPPGD